MNVCVTTTRDATTSTRLRLKIRPRFSDDDEPHAGGPAQLAAPDAPAQTDGSTLAPQSLEVSGSAAVER